MGCLRKCILKGPYTPTIVTTPAVPATEDSLAVPEQTTVETVMNMTPENRAHFESEKEAIHLILTRIGDEIYSTVDACQTAQEMWEAIERLQQGESLNIQDVKDKHNLWSLVIHLSRRRNNECRKTKRVKDSTYHKEKMLLCKQAEKGVQLQAEQSDWLADTDEEIDEQELEAHYSYMAKIQEVPNADSGTDAEPLEQVQYDTDDNVFANDIQHFEQSESITNTCAVETGDSNVIPDSPDMCDNDIQDDQMIRTLRESNSIRDSCLVALQNKQTEFERYKAFNDRTVDYDQVLERKLNETLGLLAKKEIDIKEGLKVKAYKISVVKEKHDELVKQSLLTKSHYEGLIKQKTKVITDLKLKEEKDIDKMISMENLLKFLNEIVCKECNHPNHSYLYAILHDQSDPANRLIPDRKETLTLDNESQSKLNKDLVKPFDYTKLNKIVDQAWVKHSNDRLHLRNPTAQDMEILVKTCLMPLALKTQNDSFTFVHELKQEMHADLKYNGCLKNVMCSYLQSSSDLDEITELQCLYLHKVRECDCLAQKLSEQTEFTFFHLNFDYINLLSKKDVVIGLLKLKYTWTLFLRSKDETPKVLKDFLTMIQRNLQAPLISVRTDRGTEFLNKTLNAFFIEEGIEHQTSTPRTPE
ncbi:integrase, catalytic region, zinc finger, CCHC-type containing protein [Tanacetum coccineum]|uniref:Integrase, catalytic region, zinc finger, CCHC-type containing protein n=1 Tax=Tanacetum coccineum TaxID=301880 RepID=A0ABQ4XYR7_9ASTR